MANVFVMGSGGFGTALSIVLSKTNNKVTLWGRNKEKVAVLASVRENKHYLPGVKIPEEVEITSDLEKIKDARYIILATPSVAIKQSAIDIKPLINKDAIITIVAKGLDKETLSPLYKAVEEILPENDVVVFSGPSHAEEVCCGAFTTVLCASENLSAAKSVQELFANTNLRIYTSSDPLGASLGGAFKNIIAIASGICDGMGLGDNTKAALMTRGLAEIGRLAFAMGAYEETINGLAGTGDLIVTCCSGHSRNRLFGELVGKGFSASEAIQKVDMVVEGIYAAEIAEMLAKKYNVDMPITDAVYQVAKQNADVKMVVENLFKRPLKRER